MKKRLSLTSGLAPLCLLPPKMNAAADNDDHGDLSDLGDSDNEK